MVYSMQIYIIIIYTLLDDNELFELVFCTNVQRFGSLLLFQ